MAKTHQYTATHAGQTFTRRTARTYTHVVIARLTTEPGTFHALTWCGRPDLALKELNRALSYGTLEALALEVALG